MAIIDPYPFWVPEGVRIHAQGIVFILCNKEKKLDKEIFKYLQESGQLEDDLLEEFVPNNKVHNEVKNFLILTFFSVYSIPQG